MRYSNDLRIKAIDMVESGKSQTEVYKLLNIGEVTIYRWYKQYRITKNKTYKKDYNTGRPSKIEDLSKFKQFIDNNKDSCLTSLMYKWNADRNNTPVSSVTILRAIKNKLDYTFKKNSGYIPKGMN